MDRLQSVNIDPRRPVAAWLAIGMVIADDPRAVLTTEYRRVQSAKLIHRMASGTHKRWEQPTFSSANGARPKTRVVELHVYPRSRGRILRHIGKDLEGAVELLVEHRLSARDGTLIDPGDLSS